MKRQNGEEIQNILKDAWGQLDAEEREFYKKKVRQLDGSEDDEDDEDDERYLPTRLSQDVDLGTAIELDLDDSDLEVIEMHTEMKYIIPDFVLVFWKKKLKSKLSRYGRQCFFGH